MGKKTRRAALLNREEHDPRGLPRDRSGRLLDPREQGSQYVNTREPRGRNFHIQPKNEKQEQMIQAINDNEIVIAEAPAGCGKTYISGSLASKFLAEGAVDKIILTRANVHVGKSLGMLPGSVTDKMEPLLAPILAVLRERMGDGLYSYNLAKQKIVMQPIEYIRGNSFRDTFLIIDEAQNLTVEEVQALVTRYESGRILFLGDNFQTDVKGLNGLDWLEKFANRNNLNYPVIKFGLEHIVRSSLVKDFLTALYKEMNRK
jgi:phosphate starvation-inducible PhoH-like protein